MRNQKTSVTALDAALARKTPLLRVGKALAKLELLRPTGGVDDRALGAWEAAGLASGSRAVAVGTMGAALAGAAWARARGVELHQIVRGPLTHEGLKALQIWSPAVEHVASPIAAERRAQQLSIDATLLPPLDGAVAVNAVAATLGAELVADLEGQPVSSAGTPLPYAPGAAPLILIAPAGSRAGLLGCLKAAGGRYRNLRAIALVAASREDELPDLPFEADFDAAVELLKVTRPEAAAARAWLTRTAGLLAGHAAAAAVRIADGLGAVALVTSTGEREFSLDAKVAS